MREISRKSDPKSHPVRQKDHNIVIFPVPEPAMSQLPLESKGWSDSEFHLILAVCRTAISSGDEVQIHQVRRFYEHLKANDSGERAAALKELLDGSSRKKSMTPVRLQRSRASAAGERLTRIIQPPVDRETSVPLADILWPEDLPLAGPTLPPDLQLAVENIVTEWHSAESLAAVGVHPTRSALIYGLPGTGKTHLALWLAGQLQLPVVVARLDGLISSFLGTTSRNLGLLFDFAERYNCLLLLDEFDAIGKLRDDPHEMGEIKRVVNTILQKLDQRSSHAMTIGITNHEQLLDPAVWRRFEVQIKMPTPDLAGRLSIIDTFIAPMEVGRSAKKLLGWLTEGMTGAQIEILIMSLKRLSALRRGEQLPFVSWAKLAIALHSERVNLERWAQMQGTDAALAKVLAETSAPSFDLVSLGELFGKSKSTVARWIAS